MGVGAVSLAGGGDDTGAVADRTGTAETTTITTTPPLTAATAFTRAADHLGQAGTFRYTGAVSASDVSHARPMLWLAVDSTVRGEVALGPTAGVHEVATAGDGSVSESVTDGPAVWSRRADTAEALPELTFAPVPELSEPEGTPPARGVALLPRWLRSATNAAESAPAPGGRRTFTATLPAAALGPVERGAQAVDARLRLVVAPDGTPVHVDVETVAGPRFHLAVDLVDLGAPVTVDAPT